MLLPYRKEERNIEDNGRLDVQRYVMIGKQTMERQRKKAPALQFCQHLLIL